MVQLIYWLYCSVGYFEVFLFTIAAFISFPSVFLHEACETSVSHLSACSWKIVPTFTFLTNSSKTLGSFTHTHLLWSDITRLWWHWFLSLFFSPLWTRRFLSEDQLSLYFFEHLLSPDTLASDPHRGGSSWIIYSSMKKHQ